MNSVTFIFPNWFAWLVVGLLFVVAILEVTNTVLRGIQMRLEKKRNKEIWDYMNCENSRSKGAPNAPTNH